MKLGDIKKSTWSEISKSDSSATGYLGVFITLNDEPVSNLLIFRDENDKKHFAVEINLLGRRDVTDPNINGLRIGIKQFRFNGREVRGFIDLECERDDYLDEFTQIVKEISREILVLSNDPVVSVIDVIENWKSFLATRIKEVLSEEDQIGLLCELIVLNRLCGINPNMALNSWRGPLNEKHDFVFSDWNFEIKGTRSNGHIHWINGIDQLKRTDNKALAFISFLLTISQTQNSISIQSLIELIVSGPLKNKPSLIQNFYKLLVAAGYSRIFADEYKKLQFDINDTIFFNVDEQFPKLTSENLNTPLNSRISNIRYKIDLQGLSGQNINTIQLGNYFY